MGFELACVICSLRTDGDTELAVALGLEALPGH